MICHEIIRCITQQFVFQTSTYTAILMNTVNNKSTGPLLVMAVQDAKYTHVKGAICLDVEVILMCWVGRLIPV